MFDTFNKIWKEFLEDGRITEEEYLRMTLPQYYNTVKKFSHPLVEVDHPVYQSGLRLENIQTATILCPFAEEFKTHGDRKRFVDDYIPTIRSWNESIFAGALDDTRSPKDKKDLIKSFYGTYHQRVL